MFVVGRVLDPKGKPVPGATVMVYARSLEPQRVPSMAAQVPLGDARSDASGRFRIDAPRTSSFHHDNFGAVAIAPGYGLGWVELDPDDDQPAAVISLRPEQVINGRLFDVQEQSVQGVTLSVTSIRRKAPQAAVRVRGRFDGIFFASTTANEFPAWPKPVTTDAEGRFTLRGVGQDVRAAVTVHHPRFALQTLDVETDASSESKSFSAGLAPAQIINVRVTYADTGGPVPHAPLRVMASRGNVGLPALFETDAEGRCRVNSRPSDGIYNVWAYPPDREPYLIDHNRINWPKGALEQSLELKLPRGVLIRGKVTEEGGKPITEAAVVFSSRGEVRNPTGGTFAFTASDGSFQLGALPGPGYLSIKGPSEDYMFRAIGYRMAAEGQPGGRRIYSHAHIPLDPKLDIDSEQLNVVLHRGATVKGQVVGPDGQPVRDAWMISRIILDPRSGVWSSWTGRLHGKAREGRFEIHGLDPEAETAVYFLEPKRKLGGVLNLKGKPSTGAPIVVRVEPCGTARARFVDPRGKPVAGNLRRIIAMVVTPGPPYLTMKRPLRPPLGRREQLDRHRSRQLRERSGL